MTDVPLVVLIATSWTFWLGVAIMVLRTRRRTHKRVGLVPEHRIERIMWLVWVPSAAVWMFLPYAALTRATAPFALPEFVNAAPYQIVRWIAAASAVAALIAIIRSWLRMGDDWRMDVGSSKSALITDGLFRFIRHPIYSFSMLLVVCSALVVPTAPMIGIAVILLTLWNLKARIEEQHLSAVHGETYRRYVSRTGRFFPRLRARE